MLIENIKTGTILDIKDYRVLYNPQTNIVKLIGKQGVVAPVTILSFSALPITSRYKLTCDEVVELGHKIFDYLINSHNQETKDTVITETPVKKERPFELRYSR